MNQFQIDPKSRPEFELVYDELTELLSLYDTQSSTNFDQISKPGTNMYNITNTPLDNEEQNSSQEQNSTRDDDQHHTPNITQQKNSSLSTSATTATNLETTDRKAEKDSGNNEKCTSAEDFGSISCQKTIDNAIITSSPMSLKKQHHHTPQLRSKRNLVFFLLLT